MPDSNLWGAFKSVLAWIDAHCEEFSFDIDENLDRQVLLLKPFSEFVLALHFLKRSHPDVFPFQSLLNWAWNKVERGDFLFRLLAARPDLYQLALPTALFALNDLQNERLLKLLTNVSQLRLFLKVETERWVTISVLYAYELLGQHVLTLADFEKSWLFERPEPWLITNNSAYALTHEVFYLTDFGRRKSKAPSEVVAYIDCWAPAWISYYSEKRDWDLVGELILVGQCLDMPWSNSALDLLIENQQIDGSIMGPTGAGNRLVRANDTEVRKEFLSKYHTTLVGALALSRCCTIVSKE